MIKEIKRKRCEQQLERYLKSCRMIYDSVGRQSLLLDDNAYQIISIWYGERGEIVIYEQTINRNNIFMCEIPHDIIISTVNKLYNEYNLRIEVI